MPRYITINEGFYINLNSKYLPYFYYFNVTITVGFLWIGTEKNHSFIPVIKCPIYSKFSLFYSLIFKFMIRLLKHKEIFSLQKENTILLKTFPYKRFL